MFIPQLKMNLHAETNSPTVGSQRTAYPQMGRPVLPLVCLKTQKWYPNYEYKVPIDETLPTGRRLTHWAWAVLGC